MNRETWTGLRAASGFTSDDMRRWHREFERTAPAQHRRFLKFLCIPEEDSANILAWAAEED